MTRVNRRTHLSDTSHCSLMPSPSTITRETCKKRRVNPFPDGCVYTGIPVVTLPEGVKKSNPLSEYTW